MSAATSGIRDHKSNHNNNSQFFNSTASSQQVQSSNKLHLNGNYQNIKKIIVQQNPYL